MSAFDELRCHYPLPIKEAQTRVFQTKDLDCYQENYTLHEDGTLWKTHYDVEDRSDHTAVGLRRLLGAATRVNPREVFEPFTGEVSFDTDYALEDLTLGRDGQGDITFKATFVKGHLQALEIEEHTEPRAQVALAHQNLLEEALPPAPPAQKTRL